jgi:hypothetical protein
MKVETKKQPTFRLGKEITRKQQKKVVGGATSGCPKKCKNSAMNCTYSPISTGYCFAVWPISGGVIETCPCT